MYSSERKGRYPEACSPLPGWERKSLAVISDSKLEEELLRAKGLMVQRFPCPGRSDEIDHQELGKNSRYDEETKLLCPGAGAD